MTTNFMSPGGSSAVAITGTKPSSIEAPGALIQLEPKQPRRVLRSDLAEIFLGSSGEDAIQELSGLRPGRLRVGEIAPPEHVVDADRLSHLDAEIVFHPLVNTGRSRYVKSICFSQ